MQLFVFDSLCLICANFDCEQESWHKKYTLKQMETLLSQYFLLEVSLSKKYFTIDESNFLKNKCQNDQNSFNQVHEMKKNGEKQNEKRVLSFLRKILSILENVRNRNERRMIEFEQVLLASLSTIYFLETFDSDPLLFHDILYVIKMIAFHKFSGEIKQNKEFSFPFTQKRIKRAIRKLKGRIDKIKRLNNHEKIIDCKKISFQNDNAPSSLKDITNQLSSTPSISLMDQKKKNQPIANQKKQISLQWVMRTNVNLKNLVQQLTIILQENIVFEQDIGVYFIHRFLNEIQTMQLTLAEGISECPQKSISISTNERKLQSSSFHQEEEIIEFAFIQGVPFPKNRRSVDFSILQITDKIFFSYLSSLEKLKDLEELCIRKSHLTQLSYKALKNTFPKLRSLDIRQNTITLEICELITQFKSLNILYISECRIQPKSLIEICLKLTNINVLYCDNLVFLNQDNSPVQIITEETDLRGIFYIMVLNLKKLMYFSIKGYFPPKIIDEMFRNDLYQQSICLTSINETNELKIFKNIYHTLQKRHGVVQF